MKAAAFKQMHTRSYYIINAITVYRLLAAPVLVFIIIMGNVDLFKWLLAVSFFTDLIDGYLARKYKVMSVLGAKLDSIADDLTIVAAVIAVIVMKPEFIYDNKEIIILLLGLFVLQNIFALVKYHKVSSFHTYLAKGAALAQGIFLILMFFLPQPVYFLFYTAAIITILELIEDIILVIILPKWEVNVKGLFWVMKKNRK